MRGWRSRWLPGIFCACVAAVAVACPAPGRSKGPKQPGLPAGASASGDGDTSPGGGGDGIERDGERRADEAEEILAGENTDKGGTGASDKKKHREKEQAKTEAGPPTETAPAPPARAPGPRPPDSLPGLDLSDPQREAMVAPHLARARESLVARKYDKAIAEVRLALDVDGECVEATLLLASAYLEKGWLPKAQRILVTGTKTRRGADSARLWMMLGLVHQRSGNELSMARDAYAKAAKLKPNYAKAWTNLGAVHLELGDFEQAVAALETALSIDSESVVALTNLGTAYRRRATQVGVERAKRDELVRKSENAYRTALAVDETYAPAHFDLALLYLDTDPFPGKQPAQRLRLAVRHLREYERLAPPSARAGGASSSRSVNEYLETAQQALDLLERTER